MQKSGTITSKETLHRLLDDEKLNHCFECGICTAACPMAELMPKQYNPRELLEKIVLDPENALNSEALWLCAWCYSCQQHCPQGLNLPEILLSMRTMAVEREFMKPLDGALEKIAQNIPLPLATTLVCFHPERAGIETDRALKKVAAVREDMTRKEKRKRTRKEPREKIAVVGSGPAGLTVAHELTMKGHHITIFEALPEAGGMLMKCIPEYRLPKEVVAKEIEFLRSLGIKIRTSVAIGKDITVDGLLKEGYSAIFVGSGAHRSQKLKIEGAKMEGVIHALDFLWKANSGEKFNFGQNVVVIGGGNVAVDAARTALQLGAKEVTIIYRRSREEMPANPREIKEAENEGIKIEFLVAPKRMVGEDGKVSSVVCVRMRLGEPDESGRKKPTAIEGSEFTRKADAVILATGESPETGFLPKEIELNEDGTVWVNPLTMETSMSGIFAGGDVVTGPATVIGAILAGRRAAEAIAKHLQKKED